MELNKDLMNEIDDAGEVLTRMGIPEMESDRPLRLAERLELVEKQSRFKHLTVMYYMAAFRQIMDAVTFRPIEEQRVILAQIKKQIIGEGSVIQPHIAAKMAAVQTAEFLLSQQGKFLDGLDSYVVVVNESF